MIKEVIRFRLPLGPPTDEFVRLLREVMETMSASGVEPGIPWSQLTGGREVVIEREFDSLAQYETDDAAFHRGEEFMALWRRMESAAISMTVELWQTRRDRAEVTARRVRREPAT